VRSVCSTCNGLGTVQGSPPWARFTCDTCNGAGYVERPRWFGAIAYSATTRRVGWSSACETQASANRLAEERCAASDAAVVTWGADSWLALALGDSGAWGAGVRHTREDAERAALGGCCKHAGGCRIAAAVDARDG
jgi:hypothetical protein